MLESLSPIANPDCTMLYTNWNLILCTAALFHRPLVPYAFLNSCAIFVPFHAGIILQPDAYPRVVLWNGVTPTVFWIGDFVVHVIPLFIYGLLEQENRILPSHGIVTACAHFGWALIYNRSLILDGIYVHMKRSTWITMWLLTLAMHLGIPFVLEIVAK